MNQTLSQVGGLLLGSIPTILLFVLLYGLYNVVVHKPLLKRLNERRERTEGVVQKAHAALASAEARTTEYEKRLREARWSIFQVQEARRAQVTQVRARALAEARTRAQAQIEGARALIEADARSARAGLEAAGPGLAGEVIRRVLRPAQQQLRVGGL
jgi:F-type H+-transporting ATPase subunit b